MGGSVLERHCCGYGYQSGERMKSLVSVMLQIEYDWVELCSLECLLRNNVRYVCGNRWKS